MAIAFLLFHVSLYTAVYPLVTSDLYDEACITLVAQCNARIAEQQALLASGDGAGSGVVDRRLGAPWAASGGRALEPGDVPVAPACDLTTLQSSCEGFMEVVYATGVCGILSTLSLVSAGGVGVVRSV